jgi:hypothetical protein
MRIDEDRRNQSPRAFPGSSMNKYTGQTVRHLMQRVFHWSGTSQDPPVRNGNWTVQSNRDSTYSAFPSMYFCNQIIHSWNITSKVSPWTPLKRSRIMDRNLSRSSGSSKELLSNIPFRYPKIQKSEGSDRANKEDEVLGGGICDPQTD